MMPKQNFFEKNWLIVMVKNLIFFRSIQSNISVFPNNSVRLYDVDLLNLKASYLYIVNVTANTSVSTSRLAYNISFWMRELEFFL